MSAAVAATVADAEAIDPTALSPSLYEAIDTSALNDLIATTDTATRVSFVYHGYGITVHSYRHFDEQGIEPLFPFGHGESYTDFAYQDIEAPSSAKASDGVPVSVTLENTGDRYGTEVVQVYVSDPTPKVERPPKELKAFEKVRLAPGEQTTVTLRLDRDAFTYYDPDAEVGDGAWVHDAGKFDLLVGSSSRDIRLEDSLNVAN